MCWLLEGNFYFISELKLLLFWWKWKASVKSMGFSFAVLFTSDCAVHRTYICWPEHGSIEMKHGSGEWSMDLVVPLEMEQGSQIQNNGMSIIHLVGLAIIPCGVSFLNWPMCSSGVWYPIFLIMTLVAFEVWTPMQVTLLWPDPWPMSSPSIYFLVLALISSKINETFSYTSHFIILGGYVNLDITQDDFSHKNPLLGFDCSCRLPAFLNRPHSF